MPPSFRLALLGPFLLTGVLLGEKPAPGPSAASYYPIAKGNAWTYKAGESRFVMKITEVEKAGGVAVGKLVTVINDKNISSEHVGVDGDKVKRYKVEDKALSPPVTFLDSPGQKKSWKVATTVEVDGVKHSLEGEFSSGPPEDVKVPAGAFKAVVVTSDKMKANGVDLSIKYWFAEKVGLVKQEVKLAGQTVTFELEKYQLK